MSVDTYWNFCLAHPQYGYYITRDPLGEKGDFTTAPEISQLFGEMIGIWAAGYWQKIGSPGKLHLVECGPGRGTLMADLLRIAKIIPDFLKASRIHLVETSPSLRDKQRTALQDHHITWHNDISTLPDDAPLCIVGNEFLDALPIQQYLCQNGKWYERQIGMDAEGALCFGLGTTPFQTMDIRGDGVLETSPVRERFINDVVHRLKTQSGAALMIDYGHEVPGFGDTFQAVKNHQYCNVLNDCGECDLTSHVDFGRLKTIATDLGAHVVIETQGHFLKRMGIEHRAAQLTKKSDTIAGGLHRLTDDNEMGRLFKVMEIRI